MQTVFQEKEKFGIADDYREESLRELVVYNDDVNTFAHVISTLIRVCRHSPEQAEQCTWIIHYRGKCAVKSGPFEELKPMKDAICEAGIDAKIH
jgi:ATP-dependent Clp protease adaptor protein ClpS